MDQNFIDLLIKNIDEVKLEIQMLRSEVKENSAFRWKLVGMATVFSTLISIGVAVVAAYIKGS